MNRMAAPLLACVLLLGCSYNEERSHFPTFAEFAASKYGDHGYLPSTLVPASARDIEVTYNIDSTDIEAKFGFARADAERVISPFRSPNQLRIRELERSGTIPPSKVASPQFVRCNERMVEFLQITDMTSARYWTSHDREIRKTACTPVSDAPMISA